jgi:hypothetical protein
MRSKINLIVDLGYAFDYYAILEIKNTLNFLKTEILNEVSNQMKSQLNSGEFEQIIHSREYAELLEANKKTFDAVERARYGEITAKEVDECNMQRYNAKINLQKAFALESMDNIIEVKS